MKTFTAFAFAAVVATATGSALALAQEKAQKDGARQDEETPEQRVARAKLLADAEHDYEKALALAAPMARDEKAAAELRVQALDVAARCLSHLGRNDEMRRLQVEVVAQLHGPAAEEAKRLIAGGPEDPQLELRIAKAIEEIFGNPQPDESIVSKLQKSQAATDLIWLGAPVVARLVRVLADADHLSNVTGATWLLTKIATDEAASALREAVRRSDPLYKRAVLKGYTAAYDDHEPVRSAVMSLLNDADPRVREWTLQGSGAYANWTELVALTRDPEDRVRIAAWNVVQSKLDEDSKPVEDVVVALRRCLREDRDEVRREAVGTFSRGKQSQSRLLRDFASARELFVETLLDPVLTRSDASPTWIGAMGMGNATFESPIPLDLLARVGIALCGGDPRTPLDFRDPRNHAWSMSMQRSSAAHAPPESHAGWPEAERGKVWPLLSLGIGSGISTWILQNAHPEDLPAIAREVSRCGDVWAIRKLLDAFGNKPASSGSPSIRLTEEQRSSIAMSVLPVFESESAAMDVAHPYQSRRLQDCIGVLLAMGTEEGDEALVRLIERAPDTNQFVELLQPRDPPIATQLVARLAKIPLPGDSNVLRRRNELLGRLALDRSPELPAILAKCYGLGLENSGNSKRSPCGVVWLLVKPVEPTRSQDRDFNPSWSPICSEAELRSAFAACAAVRSLRFWSDVETALSLLPTSVGDDAIARALLDLTLRHLPEAADEDPKGKLRRELARAALARNAPGWEEFALSNALEPELGQEIVAAVPEITPKLFALVASTAGDATIDRDVGSGLRRQMLQRLRSVRDEAQLEKIAGFLRDPSPGVREAAIEATFASAPELALDRVLPLAKDESDSVRAKLASMLGNSFDRRAVPVLIDLLQDPRGSVRDAAKQSLDTIQYVFDQQQKWKRVLEGAGLDSSNAAEALIKQAASGQPKATRLLAIESLGTLGVAETLPVLIQFMGDADSEIAAAAKDAVTRINTQAKSAKDVGDAKSGKDAKPPSDH